MSVVVQKYGGSSMATPELIKDVARRVIAKQAEGWKVVVVVSAMKDTTDELLRLASQISNSPKDREIDMLLTAGERVSMALLSMAINDLGYHAISFTGSQSGIITDEHHTQARIKEIRAFRIAYELSRGKIVIVAGFQGVSQEREVTTLGRGGSDTTAVALAHALRAEECEILTDVDGVFTADPRVVPEARRLECISYEEMLDLATLGGRVLHPRSVELAKNCGVVVHVRSSFTSRPGTLVKREGMMEQVHVRAVACQKGLSIVTLVGLKGRLSTVLDRLAEGRVNLQMLARGRPEAISLVIRDEMIQRALEILRGLHGRGEIRALDQYSSVASVSIVGSGIADNPGIAATLFSALEGEDILASFVSSSPTTITCLVAEDRADEAVKALHRAFDLAGVGR